VMRISRPITPRERETRMKRVRRSIAGAGGVHNS
jgi:hypothetical protein